MKTILDVRDLSYQSLFSHCTFSLIENQVTVLVGPNRSGKTVLSKILSGLIPTKEMIFFENKSLDSIDSREKQKNFFFLFQDASFPFRFSRVQEELSFYFSYVKLQEEEIQEVLEKVKKQFGLTPLLKKNPNELTLFQKIRLYFALAVILKPKVFLLDHVFEMVSPQEKEILYRDIYFLKQEKMTIFITSSKLEHALIGDKVLILHQGNILLEGSPFEVLKEDGILNKIGLDLPFFVDLSVKLQYYNLVDTIYLTQEKLVNALWKSD